MDGETSHSCGSGYTCSRGTGERAERLVNGLRERSTMGIEVVGWTGDAEGELTPELSGVAFISHDSQFPESIACGKVIRNPGAFNPKQPTPDVHSGSGTERKGNCHLECFPEDRPAIREGSRSRSKEVRDGHIHRG